MLSRIVELLSLFFYENVKRASWCLDFSTGFLDDRRPCKTGHVYRIDLDVSLHGRPVSLFGAPQNIFTFLVILHNLYFFLSKFIVISILTAIVLFVERRFTAVSRRNTVSRTITGVDSRRGYCLTNFGNRFTFRIKKMKS